MEWKMTRPAPIQSPVSITLVFIYYDNRRMLATQIKTWNSYAKALSAALKIILIDDGSPRYPAVDVVRRSRLKVPIEVYRIKEDIRWNFSGARNLGCFSATGWIYVSDMDTLLTDEEAVKLFEGQKLDPGCFYMPRRASFHDDAPLAPSAVNLLFHKSKFLEIGGYDEDYAGFYGKEETDFFNRMKQAATLVNREDVVVRLVPPDVVSDARTKGWVRDKTRNNEVYERKRLDGFENPVRPLRFTWEKVL
jgi:hypothetical protein